MNPAGVPVPLAPLTTIAAEGRRGETLLLPDDAHNRELVENVHPPGWVNPAPLDRYNLVVVGAGTAGLVSAVGAAALGARVALVEKHLLGGDFLNFGCVPSKGLLRAARAAHDAREAAAFGVRAPGGIEVDFTRAMERMRRLRAGIARNDSVRRLAGLGIDVFLGEARFIARDAVEVDGRKLRFSRAVIATGARAASPVLPGLSGAGFLTNETIFSLTQLPRRLVVVGAGPIGCEMAQAFRRFGSEVTIVSVDPRLLPREDTEASALLSEQFEREVIRTALGASPLRVELGAGGKVVVFDRGRGEEEVVGDEILLAVGRAPNVEGLNLEAAGVAYDGKGVAVDDRLRTSNRRIYAAGDICSRYKFTHAADAMARIVLRNALFLGRERASALIIPWCTYTDPEVAHVGLHEMEARERGFDVVTHTVRLSEVDRAVLDGQADGFTRVHAERHSGRILGATLVASHAGEMIGEIVLAMKAGIGLGSLAGTIHPYPTQAEAIKRLGDLHMRSRLTPRIRRFFELWFSWGRLR